MATPWLPWNQQAAQNNPAAMMNYQQIYANQGFNPANLTPAQLQQYQQWQAQYQAWNAQYGQKYMESYNAMQQACNPPLPASAQPPPPPPAGSETVQNLTEAEKNFEKEYRNWEEQYEKWKKDNEGHPNQAQYKEYEAQWENMRKGLNVRREELKRKLGLARTETVPSQPVRPGGDAPAAKPLIPTPAAPDESETFPPALTSSSVSAHNNDKRFGRPDGRGRGRGGPTAGRGRFDGNRGPEPIPDNADFSEGNNNAQNEPGENFGGPNNQPDGPRPNFNQPRGPNRNFGDQGGNRNCDENWGQNNDEDDNWQRNREDFNDGPKFRRIGGNQGHEGNWNSNNFHDQHNNRGGGNQGPGHRGPMHQRNLGGHQFPDGPGHRGPNIPNNAPGNHRPFNEGPDQRAPNAFHDKPGNLGPNPNEPQRNRGPDGWGNRGPNERPGPHPPNFPNDGPGNRGPNQHPVGPGHRGPNHFPNRPGIRGPNQFPNAGNRGPNQFPDGPRHRGPNQFPDGPRHRGPNQFPDGPGNRGPNQFPNGPGHRGFNEGPRNRGPNMFSEEPNIPNDESGNRGPFNDGSGPGFQRGNRFNEAPDDEESFQCNEESEQWGHNESHGGPQNNFNDGPGNRRPFPGPGNHRPNPFHQGPAHQGPFHPDQGPNAFHQRPGHFEDRPGFGNRMRPDNWQFNDGNPRNFDNRNWGEFQGGNENFRGPGFKRARNEDIPEEPPSRHGPDEDYADDSNSHFGDGPSHQPNISPTLLNKIPSLLDMPLMHKPQESSADSEQNETKQLSGYVGNILAKLGVAPGSPSVPVEEPKKPIVEPECVQEIEPIPEAEPEPELEWKPQVFDYSNMKPTTVQATELKFEVKDYGHAGAKKTTFDYGHGGDRGAKTFDYGHGGDRSLRSFDYGHGNRQSYDYSRDSSSASNDSYRPRFRSNRSPVRPKRSRSRSPRRPARREFKDIKKEHPESRPKPGVSPDLKSKPALQAVLVEDLIHAPGRTCRPHNIVFILRGISGSGKSFVTRLIKEKEIEFGGAPPRILSLDDYFMVESDEEVKDAETGLKKKVMKYEYDEAMESAYQAALLKAFKKTISDGFFQFIIVDAMNKNAKEVDHMWSFAKQKGFQVYICEMDNDVATCYKRNIHNRTEQEVEAQAKDWENVSNQYLQLDVRSLLQSEAIDDVVMEDVDEAEAKAEDVVREDQQADDEDEPSVSHFLKSKWDDFESSGLKLDLLDGLPKKKERGTTIEEYLSTEDEWPAMETSSNGKKRVRWADMEEKRQQSKIRAVGFVVGQTNWDRMMDPTFGESALTRTKYI